MDRILDGNFSRLSIIPVCHIQSFPLRLRIPLQVLEWMSTMEVMEEKKRGTIGCRDLECVCWGKNGVDEEEYDAGVQCVG